MEMGPRGRTVPHVNFVSLLTLLWRLVDAQVCSAGPRRSCMPHGAHAPRWQHFIAHTIMRRTAFAGQYGRRELTTSTRHAARAGDAVAGAGLITVPHRVAHAGQYGRRRHAPRSQQTRLHGWSETISSTHRTAHAGCAVAVRVRTVLRRTALAGQYGRRCHAPCSRQTRLHGRTETISNTYRAVAVRGR